MDDEAATEYHSFSDSDSDSEDDDAAITEEARKLERETRAAERQLVLEAAGIVVVAAKHDEMMTMRPPPPPPLSVQQQRPRFERPKRRPPPALPTPTPRPADIDKPLPLPRTIDDAYERYEAFKQRTSISSFEQLLVPPASVVSRESHPGVKESGTSAASSYGSIFSQLLARSRTPVQDRETRVMPTISAPILSPSSSAASGTLGGTPVLEEGPAFGSVSRRASRVAALLMGVVVVLGEPCEQVRARRPAGS